MKKISMKVVACLMAGSLMSTSCIGSFSLFNKYAHWQRTMTSNKYVNAIVGFFLMPIIGGITLFVDSVVLNTIEFWSGDNPGFKYRQDPKRAWRGWQALCCKDPEGWL